LAKEASVLCCGNTRGLVRVWKFYDSDDDDNDDIDSDDSDSDDSSSSDSSSNSSRGEKEEEKTAPKEKKSNANANRRRQKRRVQSHHHGGNSNRRNDGVRVTDLKGLPKETVVRQAEVSFDGKIVLAGCDGGYIYRWDIEQDIFD